MQLPHNISDKLKHSGHESPENGESEAEASGSQQPTHMSQDHEFSEFLWMANEDLEAFDQKVINELDAQLGISPARIGNEEEDFLQRMLEEEEERDTVYFNPASSAARHNGSLSELSSRMQRMEVSGRRTAQSNLNPLAAEFIPGQNFQGPTLNSQAPMNLLHNSQGGHMLPNQLFALPVNGHQVQIRQQLNGHTAPVNRFYNGVPVYVANMPLIPMVNGSLVAPPQNHIPNDDEGYGDN